MEPNSVTNVVERVELAHSLTTFTDRTNKMAEVLQDLRKKDVFSTLDGWRDEVNGDANVNINYLIRCEQIVMLIEIRSMMLLKTDAQLVKVQHRKPIHWEKIC